jgi:hypothetical protein
MAVEELVGALRHAPMSKPFRSMVIRKDERYRAAQRPERFIVLDQNVERFSARIGDCLIAFWMHIAS